MLAGGEVPWTGVDSLDEAFRSSTIYRSAAVAAGKAGVTYMSAKSFADAALEVARTSEQVPAGLAARMEQVYTDVGNDITRLKAGLESWFDETMAVVESQYKKWATTWLFFVGFGLAILVNASAVNVASDMWHDSATRRAPAPAPDDGASATSAVLRGRAGPEPDLGGPGGGSAPAEHTRDLEAPGAERAPAGRDAAEPARGLSAGLVGLIGSRPPAGGLANLPARPQAGNATRRLAGR